VTESRRAAGTNAAASAFKRGADLIDFIGGNAAKLFYVSGKRFLVTAGVST
jgi:hypothetical protein